jgi:acyl-CoA thioester hydrolase
MITDIRVQFKDVDLSQRIHYTVLFSYFEVADHSFFHQIGYPYKQLFEQGNYFPRVHVECDYLGMIQYDDILQIKTSIAKIGNSSFTYLFQITQKESGLEVARGKMVNVCIDKHSGKPQQLPDYIKEKMKEHLTEGV